MSLLRRAIGTARVLAQVRRDRRVRAIVAHAYRTVPYYRGTMRRLGLTPADFASADDLARLPLLSKAEIAADPERLRSTAVDPAACLALTITGTSGPRFAQGFQALVGETVRVEVERVEAIPTRPGGKVAVISALPRA